MFFYYASYVHASQSNEPIIVGLSGFLDVFSTQCLWLTCADFQYK